MSYLALYRKYRPQVFAEVIGQDHITKTLQNALSSGMISHAFLFTGPRGTGKTTVARLVAKAVNCQRNKSEPCNKCENCLEIKQGKPLDLVEIDAASNRGIDEIRDVREKTRFTPVHFKFKVFIIDEVHMLTAEAFNALLKTLEEPPSHVIFILATTAPHKVPHTIISRCQRFDFHKISSEQIKNHLARILKKEKAKYEEEALALIASLSDGSCRDALSMLSQCLVLEGNKITLKGAKYTLGITDKATSVEMVEYLILNQVRKAIDLVDKVQSSGVNLAQFIESLLEYLRKIFLAKVDKDLTCSFFDLTPDEIKKIAFLAENVSNQRLVKIIKNLLEAKEKLEQTSLPQLPLEIAIWESVDGQVKEAGRQKQKHASDKNLSSAKASSNLRQTEKALNSIQIKKESRKEPGPGADKKISSNPGLSLVQIKEKWPLLLEQVKSCNFPLFVFLKSSQPQEFTAETLTLGLAYNFHKERIEQNKNRLLIESLLSQQFNRKIKLQCVVKETTKKNSELQKDDLISEALRIFKS